MSAACNCDRSHCRPCIMSYFHSCSYDRIRHGRQHRKLKFYYQLGEVEAETQATGHIAVRVKSREKYLTKPTVPACSRPAFFCLSQLRTHYLELVTWSGPTSINYQSVMLTDMLTSQPCPESSLLEALFKGDFLGCGELTIKN